MNTRLLSITLLASIALTGCDHTDDHDHDHPTTQTTDSEPPPSNPNVIAIPASVRQNLGITFAKPEYRRVANTLRVPGRFELLPTARHELRAPFGGRVELLVKQYDAVQAGQVVARISSPEWHRLQLELEEDTAEITKARAELAIAEQSLIEGQTKSKLLEDRVARLQTAEMRRTELESDLSAAKSALPRLEAEVAAKRAALHAAEHHLPLAEAAAASQLGIPRDELLASVETPTGKLPRWQAMSHVEVGAVDAGIVESLSISDGGRVDALGPIVTTIDPTQLRFRAVALQADLHRITPGQVATVVASADGGNAALDPIVGKLHISPDADSAARTIDVLLSLQNASDTWPAWARPGLSAQVEIPSGSADEELAIPNAALIQDGLQRVYFKRDRKNPDQVLRTEADLGTTDGQWTIINSGLSDADEVVLHGIYELKLASSQQGGASTKGGHFHADGTWHADGEPEPGSKK
jgi:multidrug efflux pump subunit AcrA (membrane-fusion protein)